MPVESRWYNEEKTIIIQTFVSPYTFEELYTDYKQMNIMLNEVSYQVDFIGDLQAVRSTPRGMFSQLSEVRKTAPPFNHPRSRMLVYIMGNNLLVRLVRLFMTMFPDIAKNMYAATSLEAAEIIIQKWKERETSS